MRGKTAVISADCDVPLDSTAVGVRLGPIPNLDEENSIEPSNIVGKLCPMQHD